MGTTVSTPRWPGRRTEAAILFFILAIAALFRFYQLTTVPPGFTHDEAGHGHDAIAIVHGARPLYETVGYGREPLYDYVVAMFMPFLGENYLTLRIISALSGLFLIVVMHFWVRRAFDVPTAIATSAFLATSFWATMVSRQALRSALLPLLFTAAIFFMWQAVRPYAKQQTIQRRWPMISRLVSYTLAGLFLGLSLMTYMAARVLPIVFVLFWIYLFIFHRKVWRDNWFGVFFIIGLGLLIAWPMFNYIAATPGAEQRLSQLSGPIDQLFAGKPQELLSNIFGALGMFMFYGDNLWLYNIPGRALLGLILGPMALVGLVIGITRFKRMEYALAIFWLAAGIFPSLITGVVASNLRSIAALPVVYLFVAIGLVEIMRGLERLVESHTLRTIPLALLAVGVTLFSWNAYFDQWATARDVRVAYNTTLFEVAQELDQASDLPTDVAISSIYPNRFHDPYAMQLTLQRKDMPLRWFTGSFVDMNGVPHASMIFPQPSSAAAGCAVVQQQVECATGITTTQSVFTSTLPAAPVGPNLNSGATLVPAAPPNYDTTVVVQSIAPIDPVFIDAFNRHSEKIRSIELRPDDFNPRFDIYRFDAAAALTDALKSAVIPTATLNFANTVNLIGSEIRTPQVKPGQQVEVITYWRITTLYDQEATLFTHMLSGDSTKPVLAQQDSLDVPSYYWLPGDAFAQVHRFTIPGDAQPGSYPLEVGLYTLADQKRLPLLNASGDPVGDHTIIGSITVTP
jgi:4-amino-4-deoxy-L-arabinose transferase-like glycosyltransferase